ncbi:hypothetical protein H4Q26_014684 [Puccinia striiformis f. sp. tritici PST-130]|nr:hypothetical protein H4Q26_014684 [Puccinia striiformis f. sp. tritici PST-130]
MRALCWVFGIYSKHCMVLDHPDLPDSMLVWWPEKTILEFVKLYIDLWNTGAIITFNHHGVSGHINHQAIASALRHNRNHESFLPELTHPKSHPTRDKKHLANIVLKTSIYPNKTNDNLSSLNLTSSNLDSNHTLIDGVSEPNNTDHQESINMTLTAPMKRITDSRLSTHSSVLIFKPTKYYKGRRAFNQHISQQV